MIIKSRGKLKDGYNREHILSVEKTNKSNYQVEHINSIKSLSQNHAFNLFLLMMNNLFLLIAMIILRL